MRPIDALAPQEKAMIQSYIRTYGTKHEGCDDVDYILRFWNQEKEKLFKLFGEKLIIQKDYEYQVTDADLVTAFDFSFMRDVHVQTLHRMLKEVNVDFVDNLTAEMYAMNYFALDNQIVYLPRGEKYHITRGTKLIKVLRRICEAFGFMKEFTEVMNIHSRALNVKDIRGTLNLSIHPMDYLTMSDTPYNWHTCMSWTRNQAGSQRCGSVEMLNSSYVVVAYISGPNDLAWDRFKWPGKKWRCLFIVDDDFITSIKSYPFVCEHTTITVMKELMKLKGWNDNNAIYPFTSDIFEKGNLAIEFNTDLMHNDFCTTKSYITFADDLNYPQSTRVVCNYSGQTECMCCGKLADIEEFRCVEQTVMCEDCQPRVWCEHCGTKGLPDEMISTPEGNYCTLCYEDEFFLDEISQEARLIDHLALIAFAGGKTFEISDEWFDTEEWYKYFTIPYQPIMSPEHLTELGKERFNLNESTAD